ncbi:MAG: hypothetical protein MJ252_03965 [archaeon]|nr:hypothetical protein [archaeon]
MKVNSKIFFFLLFSSVSLEFFDLNTFNSKNAFLLTKDDLSSLDLSSVSFNNIHPNLAMIKLEPNKTMLTLNHRKNHMSLYISDYFYKHVICLDKKTHIPRHLALRMILQDKMNKMHYKNSDCYADIDSQNKLCFERMEYIDDNINLKEKNSKLHRNYIYNLVHNTDKAKMPYDDYPLFSNRIINVNLYDVHTQIKKLLGGWNKHCSYELIFICNDRNMVFELQKVFIYNHNYNPNESDLSSLKLFQGFIQNNLKDFNQIYIYNQNKKETIKYSNSTKKYELLSKDTFGFISPYFYNLKVETDKKESVYHNYMKISFPEEMIDNYYKEFKKDKDKDKLCYLIHEILNEDVYIEKNEFKTLVNEYFDQHKVKINYDLYASKFIEQELSSDLSQHAYFSFYFCTEKENIKKLNYAFKFPIHFRYQPSLRAETDLTHQTVIMPQPHFGIYEYDDKKTTNENYLNHFFDDYFENLNIRGPNQRIFDKEIKTKLNTILNEDKFRSDNYETFKHLIPGGQMKYFNLIALVTSIVSLLGFFMIFYGLINYEGIEEIKYSYSSKKTD